MNIINLSLEIESTPMLGFASQMPLHHFVQRLNQVYELDLVHSMKLRTGFPAGPRPDWVPQEVTGDMYIYYDEMHLLLYLFVRLDRQEVLLFGGQDRPLDRLLFIHGETAHEQMHFMMQDIEKEEPTESDPCDLRAAERETRRRQLKAAIQEQKFFDFTPPKFKPDPEKDSTGDPLVDGMCIVQRKPKDLHKQQRQSRMLVREYPDPMANLGQLLLNEADAYFRAIDEREEALRQSKIPHLSYKELRQLRVES